VLAATFPDVGVGLTAVSLAFGLTVLTMAYALGPISGGHFNPAVTWMMKQRGLEVQPEGRTLASVWVTGLCR
jgi:glycerol uptake facilitator-like aquaporin